MFPHPALAVAGRTRPAQSAVFSHMDPAPPRPEPSETAPPWPTVGGVAVFRRRLPASVGVRRRSLVGAEPAGSWQS